MKPAAEDTATKGWKQDSNPGPVASMSAFRTTLPLGASQQKAGAMVSARLGPSRLMLPAEVSGAPPAQVGQEGFPRKEKDGEGARKKGKEQRLVLACGQLGARVWSCLVPTFRHS